MKIKRRTEVIIQTERFLIVRKRQPSFLAVCAECGSNLMAPEQAAVASGKSPRDIYREIENGELHFTEMSDGRLLVCCG